MDDKKPIYKFGLKRSTDDPRDKVLCFYEYEKIQLPLKFSLEDIHKDIEPFDQGNLNLCSANALSNQIKLSNDDMFITPSRLFTYFNSRIEDIQENRQSLYISDEGASLRNTYKSIMKYNCLDERYFGYYEEKVNVFPSADIYIE